MLLLNRHRWPSGARLSLIFVLSCLVFYFLAYHDGTPEVLISPDPLGTWAAHPIVQLHEQAKHEFNALLSRQSKSADEAERTYRARYKQEPPPGFREWVEYALSSKAPIIDDYDTIAATVHPFLEKSATSLQQFMNDATDASAWSGTTNDKVRRCAFSSRSKSFNEGCGKFAAPLKALLGDAVRHIPDVEFLINFLDEPVVLSDPGYEGIESQTPSWVDESHEPLKNRLHGPCRIHPKSYAQVLDQTLDIDTLGMSFVKNVRHEKNLCSSSDLDQHGFTSSPVTMRHTQVAVPILSQAAPQPFRDILYPSTHYSLSSSLYSAWWDKSWSRKRNAVYWTGSTTGGFWTAENWRKGHRQRLDMLATGNSDESYDYLRSTSDGKVEKYTSQELQKELYDVHITSVVSCADQAVCDEMNASFGMPGKFDHDTRPYAYKYVLDIDGNSYSGRFYRLLASHSVPLKISIFNEWHDDRLIPWMHYVPISLGMKELPEVMRFLATTQEGQRISQTIAEAGRDWYLKATAPEQQGMYVYRLMLELARMMDPTRTLTVDQRPAELSKSEASQH